MVKTRHSADADDLAYGEFITVATRTNRREAALKSRNYRDDDSDDFEDEPPPTRRRTRGKRNITIFGGSTTDDETPPKDTRRGRFRDTGAMDDSLEDGGLPSRRHAPHHHLPPDSEIRRSGRQRKLTYDTLNQGLLNKQLAYLSASEMNGYHDQLIDQPIKKRKRTEVHIEPEDEEAVVDMYTRVKRERRHVKRNMYGVPIEEKEGESSGDDRGEDEVDEEDENEEETEEEEEPHQNPRSYFLREQRQRTQIYEAPIEPKRNRPRSIFREGSPPINRTRNSSRGAIHRSPARRKSIRRKAAFHRSSSTSSSSDPGSSDDERRFERRKAKSMVKSRQRCLPMNLSQDDVSKGFIRDRVKIGSSLADVDPMNIDRSVTFEKVGGLGKHIRALKEMVVFPLLYPEVFDKFKITPPRGVLFYGPPGTGKTLVARALANECSTGEKKVAFFMRKGADCLSKWVGESERQLRLLFDQAYQMRPAIIFFDEIDGLAPVRSSRQDQIHSSIVSTLLALMDGLDNRGEIVVIGATNRIDSIDPALRRPGRFDREFLFPLPSVQARSQILQIHTSAWSPKLSDRFIHELADKCVGYCGADLRALCTEAALQALRRRYPQIYNSQDKLQLDTSAITVNAYDFHRGTQIIVPTAQRSASSPARALSHTIQPLLHELLHQALGILKKIFPPALSQISSVDTQASNNGSAKPADGEEFCSDIDEEGADIYEQSTKGRGRRRPEPEAYTGPFLDFTRSSYHHPTTHRPRLLLTGEQGQGQSTHIAPGILYFLERMPVHVMDLPALYAVSAKTPEESCAHIFREAKRTCPSIIYVPHIDHWWEVIGDTLRATFLTLLRDLEPSTPLLFLATSDEGLEVMPITLRQLFNNQTEVLQMRNPSADERREYFQDLLLNQATKPPAMRKQAAQRALEVLPKAPAPPPPTLTDTELKRLTEQEEVTLRELRLFLREVLNKLGRDRKFALFAKPVDEEEVPDYYNIIASPMDLSTMMNKIDLHKYQTVADFMRDVELIVSNALEYNPEKDPADRAIRHRACTLKDTAQAILAAELDEGFEKLCEEIKESMDRRGAKASASVPSYYFTKPLGRGRQGLRDAVNGPDNVSGRASRHAAVMDPEAPLSSNAGTNDDDEVIVPKVRTIIKRVMLPRSKNRHTSPWCRPSKRAYRKIVVYLDEQGNEIGQESTLPRARQDKPKQEEEEEPEEDETEDKQEEKSEEEVENETKDSDKGINSVDNNGNTLSVDVSEREASPKRATPSPRSALSPRGRPSPASPRQSRSPRGEGARGEKSPASSLERSGRSSRDRQKTEAQTPCTGLSNKKRPRTLSEQSDAEAMDTAVTKETSDTEVTIKSADNSPKKTNSPSKTTTTTTAEETATEEKTEEVMETEEKSDSPKMRVTRSQMHPSDHQRALELLSETSQSVLVDEARLRALLARVVRLTEGHNVEQLERLYSSLSQCIYHHRRDANKMELLQSARNKRYQQRRSGPKLVPIAWDLIFDMEAVIASYSFKI